MMLGVYDTALVFADCPQKEAGQYSCPASVCSGLKAAPCVLFSHVQRLSGGRAS
jgi:hypothetical protein